MNSREDLIDQIMVLFSIQNPATQAAILEFALRSMQDMLLLEIADRIGVSFEDKAVGQ